MGDAGVSGRMTLRETIRIVRGQAPLLALHLERLGGGGVGTGTIAEVEAATAEAARTAPPEAVKLQVTVGSDDRFSVSASDEPSSLNVPGGPMIVPVTVSRTPELPPNAAKPADRTYWDGPQRLARMRGGHQAVLVLPDGTVVDGGTATVWVVLGETLVTPRAPPAMAGVARLLLLRELAPALGLRAEVRMLTLGELDACDEVLLSNAAGGVVAARGRGGRLSETLARAFEARLGL